MSPSVRAPAQSHTPSSALCTPPHPPPSVALSRGPIEWCGRSRRASTPVGPLPSVLAARGLSPSRRTGALAPPPAQCPLRYAGGRSGVVALRVPHTRRLYGSRRGSGHTRIAVRLSHPTAMPQRGRPTSLCALALVRRRPRVLVPSWRVGGCGARRHGTGRIRWAGTGRPGSHLGIGALFGLSRLSAQRRCSSGVVVPERRLARSLSARVLYPCRLPASLARRVATSTGRRGSVSRARR